MRNAQQGVVLIAVLLLLLLTSIVVFSAMGTSDLEAKMAAARLGQETSFQATESSIDVAKNDGDALVAAYINGLDATATPYSADAELDDYAGLSGTVTTRYRGEALALGNDIVIGSAGLRSLHFEIVSEVDRDGDDTDRFDSIHRQGIRRYAPKVL